MAWRGNLPVVKLLMVTKKPKGEALIVGFSWRPHGSRSPTPIFGGGSDADMRMRIIIAIHGGVEYRHRHVCRCTEVRRAGVKALKGSLLL